MRARDNQPHRGNRTSRPAFIKQQIGGRSHDLRGVDLDHMRVIEQAPFAVHGIAHDRRVVPAVDALTAMIDDREQVVHLTAIRVHIQLRVASAIR